MGKPTVRDFRSPRICQRVFANTSEAIILEAINAAYDDYRIRRNLRSTVLAAAHLIARDDDDIMAMEGVAANAVDFGSGGGIVVDEMDGDRRVITRQGAGVSPGSINSASLEDDVDWWTTSFGRRMLQIERRQAASRPMVFM